MCCVDRLRWQGKPGQVYTRPCDPAKAVTTDCYTIAPINPATRHSVRLRNTSMETFQVTYNPLDGNADHYAPCPRGAADVPKSMTQVNITLPDPLGGWHVVPGLLDGEP